MDWKYKINYNILDTNDNVFICYSYISSWIIAIRISFNCIISTSNWILRYIFADKYSNQKFNHASYHNCILILDNNAIHFWYHVWSCLIWVVFVKIMVTLFPMEFCNEYDSCYGWNRITYQYFNILYYWINH